MADGTTSLLSSTVYALSDAATQFSKAAHKVPCICLLKSYSEVAPLKKNSQNFNSLQGIVAFTFNDHDVARMEKQQMGEGSRSKGVIGEVFEVYHLHFLCLYTYLMFT